MPSTVKLTTPLADLETRTYAPGTTINELYRELGLSAHVPVTCQVDGEYMLRAKWDLPLPDGSSAVFELQPMGGEDSGKAMLRTVAMIAVVVAAPYAAGAMTGATEGVALAITTAGIAAAGSFLINALIPFQAEDPSTDEKKSRAKSSTYSVSARGNRARLLEPIPKLYGRHRMYPDYVSQPFTEYENNAQVLYQHFALGLGQYDLEKILVSDTALWENGTLTENFEDVEVELLEPGEVSSLYPGSVASSELVTGLEVQSKKAENLYDVSGGNRFTMAGASGGNSDFEETLGVFELGDVVRVINTNAGSNGGTTADNITYEVINVAEDGTWVEFNTNALVNETGQRYILDTSREDRWVGPFPASPAGTVTEQIKIDIALPRGLYSAKTNGTLEKESVVFSVFAGEIDDTGTAIGDYFSLTYFEEIEKATATPVYQTLSFAVDSGRYEVRMIREDREEGLVNGGRIADAISWIGLKALVKETVGYEGVSTLAVKIRATNQLSSAASDKLSVIQTAMIPTYDDGDDLWITQKTQNPVWALVDMLRNSDYGAGIADDRLDLDTFVYYAQLAETRGDKFNAIFDTKRSLWQGAQDTLRVMRAQPVVLGDTYSMIRDETQTLAKAVFSPRTITKNSLTIDHLLRGDSSPDHVIIEFIDEDYWDRREVVCAVDSRQERPARITLFGCTDRDQAYREGMYAARSDRYRRTFATVTTEMDGRVLLRGDKVLLSHDMPQWGQSSEAVSYDAGTRTLTVVDEFLFEDGVDHVIVLRAKNGSQFGPITVTQASPVSVVLDAASLAAVGDIEAQLTLSDYAQERNRVLFGTTTNYAKEFVVLGIQPRGLDKVQVSLANYDTRILLDAGETPPDTGGTGSGEPDQPIIGFFNVVQNPGATIAPIKVTASWTAAKGADFYQLQYSYDGEAWTTVYEGGDTSAQASVQPGTLYFRVAGFGALRGPYNQLERTFGLAGAVSAGMEDNTITSDYDDNGTLSVTWDQVVPAETYLVTVTSGADTLTVVTSDTRVDIDASRIASSGGPWASYTVSVASVNSAGTSPTGSVTGTIVIPAPTNAAIVNDWEGPDHSIVATWTPLPQFESYSITVRLGGSSVYTETVYSPMFVMTAQKMDEFTIKRILAIDIAANAGSITTGIATVTVTDTAPAVPTNITTASPATGKVTVDWDAVADDDLRYYRLYASASSGFTPGASNLIYQGTTSSATISGLPSGGTIYMVLVAVDYVETGLNESTEFSQAIT
jgi:hypothetical protein